MYPQPGKELQILISSMSFKADSKTTYHSVMNSLINVEPLVAQIWLEKVFCDVFEEHFGLIWEPQTNMYFVNDTQHDINISRKMSITFVILSNSTNITFPYTDFALTASYPLVPTSRRYFPLRRATYTSQVMLGRAFIQGAYLIADYDRKTFNISQVKTAKDLKPRIRAIPPPAKDAVNNTVIPVGLSVADKVADAKSHKLAAQTRVTAAASLTSVSVIIGIIGLFIWRRFRSRQKSEIVIPENGVIKKKEVPLHFDGKAELDGKTALPPEVHAEDLKEMDASQAPKELESKRFRYELPADVPAELYGDMPWQEKDAWVHELEVPDKKRVSKWRSFLRRKSEKEVIIKLNQEKCAMPDKSTVAIENHKKTHTTKQVDANTEKEDETNTKNQDKAVTEEAGFAKDEGSHATEHDRRTESEDHERSYDGG
jgi:hypothetical protein